MSELVQNQHVLIIEDSQATALLLKNYLNNMGYEEVHTCQNGKTGIETFTDLVNAGSEPFVLLDYMLPDMDARSIMTRLLEIKPDVKVILQTATEKSDSGITELIRQGLYQYLEKPIRFDKLKEIITILEEEKHILENTPKTETLGTVDAFKEIDFLLKSHKQITLAMIEEYAEAKGEDVIKYLDDLESKGKIVKLDEKREIACRQCGSVKIAQTFFCPSCKENDFKITKLIEHFKCGNFSPEASYEDDKCPKCKKEIKAVGVDYRIMQNQYVCNSCGEIFNDISYRFLCLKCENKFPIEEVRWITSPFFKAIKM
jgi:response regulator of citrate/malate metabolism